jgi:hypothetical protein
MIMNQKVMTGANLFVLIGLEGEKNVDNVYNSYILFRRNDEENGEQRTFS